MMKPTTLLCMALGLIILLSGCGLIEPKDSELKENLVPETVLTAMPPDVYDHTVTFNWRGEDSDGIILYFETRVDEGAWVHTTRSDTTIVFGVADDAMHSFEVRAYDDDGDVDPTPASRSFTATSIAPETVLMVAPAESALVGPAITIELNAEDPDDKSFMWRYRLDDNEQWSEWTADSAFAFAQPSIVPGALGILSVGFHTFYGQVRDAAGIIDPTPASVLFQVGEGTQPTTSLTLCQIDGRETYTDYSMFTNVDNENAVHFEVSSSAAAYNGVLAGYSYIWTTDANLPTAQFSDWVYQEAFDFADVAPGKYWFIFKARDTAGSEDATPESLFVDIVDPRTELDPNAILVVQETRDGTGRPGSPSTAQVTEYYATMLAGRTYTLVNYDDLGSANLYVSPAVAGRYGLIIWIDDDSSDHFLFSVANPENIRFVNEYLDLRETFSLAAPTHLLLSHWNLPGASNVDWTFLADVFGVTSATSSTNGNDKTLQAAQGQGVLAGTTLTVDPAKVLATWAGKINKVWAFEAPAGATELTTWVSASPDSMDGRTNAFHRTIASGGEVVITGYPLYFMTDAPVFMDRVLQMMGF